VNREITLTAPPEALFVALASEGGLIAAMGGPAARGVRIAEREGLSRLVLEGAHALGRTTIDLAPTEEGGALVAFDCAASGPTAEQELDQLAHRVTMLAAGAFGVDVACRAEPLDCWAAWHDPRANRAFAGLECEGTEKPTPGLPFVWRSLDRGPLGAEATEAGTVLEVEEGRRLLVDWESEPGTTLEVRFLPLAALGGAARAPSDDAPRTLVTVTHTGFSAHALSVAAARAEAWLARLTALAAYVDGALVVEEAAIPPRAALTAALAVEPQPGEGTVFVVESHGGGALLRWARPDLEAGSGRPLAYEAALGTGRLLLARLQARAQGHPLSPEDAPYGSAIGPRSYVEEIAVAVPPEIAFRALSEPKERARWTQPTDPVPRLLAEEAPRVRLESMLTARPDALTLARFTVERRPGGGSLVRLEHAGFQDDDAGLVARRRERLGWAFRLLCLRAYLERGLDLRPLSGTGKHYPDETEAEVVIDAPPAQVFRAITGGAKERRETLLGGSDEALGTAVAVRALEDAREVALVTWRVAREGAGARLRCVVRGFSSEEEFWTVEERARLIPAMALAFGGERDRIDALALSLDRELSRPGTVKVVVEAEADPADAWALFAEPLRLSSALGGAAAMEPWAGGAVAWPAIPGAPALSGAVVDAERTPDAEGRRRMVLRCEPAEPPTLAEIVVETGTRHRARIIVRHLGFSREPELKDAAEAAWSARLERIIPWLEGAVERRLALPCSAERAWAALTLEGELRAYLDPAARIEVEERVYVIAPGAGAAAERCRALVEEPPRRLALSWPFGRGSEESLPDARLDLTLEEEAAPDAPDAPAEGEGEGTPSAPAPAAAAPRVTAVARVSEVPEGVDKPRVMEAEGRRLSWLLAALATHLARSPEMPAPPAEPRGDERALEIGVLLARTGQEAAFAAVRARLARAFGEPLVEAAPSLLTFRVTAAPGQPEGDTRATIRIEGAGETGSRILALEEGFLEGEAWDARLAVEERGFTSYFEELRRADADAP